MSNGCWSKSELAVPISSAVAKSFSMWSEILLWVTAFLVLSKDRAYFLYLLASLLNLSSLSESSRANCLSLNSWPSAMRATSGKTSRRNFCDLHVILEIESFTQTPLSYLSHSFESWLYRVSSLNLFRSSSAQPLSPLWEYSYKTLGDFFYHLCWSWTLLS